MSKIVARITYTKKIVWYLGGCLLCVTILERPSSCDYGGFTGVAIPYHVHSYRGIYTEE